MSSLDVLRTRVRDMLFGRTKIKVVNQNTENDVLPVFLIGTFRSGTTLFRFLLDSHTQLCCPPETKFLEHLASMHSDPNAMKAFDNMGFDEPFIRQQMKSFANGVYATHLQGMEKQFLVDKTPEYVRVLNFLDWLYEGKCKYIMIFRNGLDVAHSMNEMEIKPIETGKTIDKAFEYWKSDATTMLQWMKDKPEQCHKVVYNDLCDNTETVLRGVMNFIDLEFQERQLQWYEHQHSRGDEDIKARRQRTINKSVHNYQEWSDDVIDDLKLRSADIHSEIGFDPVTLELK